MKIFDVEITDLEAHRNNSPAHQEAIFAHLPYWDRQEAVKQLQEALKPKGDKAEPQQEGKEVKPIKAVSK